MRAHRLLVIVISALLGVGLAACGGDDEEPAEPPPAEEADEGAGGGEVAAGRQIFDQQGCGSCHTLAAADATATIGPNRREPPGPVGGAHP